MEPRPSDITQDDIDSWEAERQEYIACEAGQMLREPPAEVWYTGCWLKEQLLALGCQEKTIESICFAAGQRQAMFNDYWKIAKDALENYKKGIVEKPGANLADALMREKFGDKLDAHQAVEFLSDHPHPEKLWELFVLCALKGKSVLPQPPESDV
jgi:hypothetical protein